MYIFGMISENEMEGIADEVLADLALDEGRDCWDLAVIQHILQQEEERIELERGFDLQKFFGVVGATPVKQMLKTI